MMGDRNDVFPKTPFYKCIPVRIKIPNFWVKIPYLSPCIALKYKVK